MGEIWPGLVITALWVGVILSVVIRFLDSKKLVEYSSVAPADPPLVTVVIPARNEAHNIARCLRSVLNSSWPALEVIVVNDHSTDKTADLARQIAAEDAASHGDTARVQVIDAGELPPGWFGKQWACHTGYQAARGEILCFTDADTRHSRDLLKLSVNAMRKRGAELFTVAGKQEMISFWEKVMQPFIFALLLSRYGGLEGMSRTSNPKNKIANGQFMMFARKSYELVGGHEAVRANVAEDLQLAQRFTEADLPVHMVLAYDHLTTRMYTSLGEIRRGWGKNVYAAGRDTFPLGPITKKIFPFVFPIPALVPLAPYVVLVLGVLEILGPSALIIGVVVSTVNIAFWIGVYTFSRLNPLWGLTHPLAALVFAWICVEAAWRGANVQWKGRDYVSR